MNKKNYIVRVLVGDGKPGLLPFTWYLSAEDRDDAIAQVRRRTRARGNVVKHIDFARQAQAPAR